MNFDLCAVLFVNLKKFYTFILRILALHGKSYNASASKSFNVCQDIIYKFIKISETFSLYR